MAVAVSFGVKKREVVRVHHTASVRPISISRQKPEQIVLFAVDSLFLSCGCPNGQVRDVIDDCSEGLPVSVVEHGLVDGRKTNMVILPHLVLLLMQTEGGVLFFVSSKHWRSKEKGSKSRELAPVCCFDS